MYIALLDHVDLIKWKKDRDACMISYGSIGQIITFAIPCPGDDLA